MSALPSDCTFFVTLARIVGLRYTGPSRTIHHDNRSEELVPQSLVGVDVSKHNLANPSAIDVFQPVVLRTVNPNAMHTNDWRRCDEFDADVVASLCSKIDVLLTDSTSSYKPLWDDMKRIVDGGEAWCAFVTRSEFIIK